MKNKRKFLRCEICGNIVEAVEDVGISIVCCGQDMDVLEANTVDASQEKHVPVATLEDGVLTVKVGSVIHPQTKEHHISWIAIAQGDLTQRMTLDPEGQPEASFCLAEEETVTLYAYCNLHGLWAADVL